MIVKATNATDLLTATSPCEILYDKKAWMKIGLLVENRNQEVGWHGIVKRSNRPAEFIVEDILVFPQKVTLTSVTPDEKEYMEWQDTLDSEVFNNIRLHGHSHVNMGVEPSATDMKYREDLLTDIEDFYVFQIFNKKGYISTQVYDIKEGVLYENDQVKIVLEQFDSATYDLCRAIVNNINMFRQTDARELLDGVEWTMSTANEFEKFMMETDSAIAESHIFNGNFVPVWDIDKSN